jgi:hypothetical protein
MMVQEEIIVPIIVIKVQRLVVLPHHIWEMVVVNHLMEVKVEIVGMMEMMKVVMAVLAAAAAVVQIIWVQAAAAAILVVAVIEGVCQIVLEEVEVPIMGDLIQPTLQDPLQNGVITVR